MNTTIRQYQEQVAEILNKDPFFAEHNAFWLAEDKLNISYEIRRKLAETGLVCIVSTPSLDYQGTNHLGDMQFDATIRLQILENPTINRERASGETALALVHHAVYTLCGYETGNFNNFTPTTIEQNNVAMESQKLLEVTAEVKSTVTL